ncbi:MAG: CHAT domain-containing protein [Firmicutes bacterium]|nr:CHAT domain-containing protein [Bacillota bacterium]
MKKGITLILFLFVINIFLTSAAFSQQDQQGQFDSRFSDALALAEKKQFNDAFEAGKELIALAEKLFNPPNNKTVGVIFFTAEMALKSGQYEQAEFYYKKAAQTGNEMNPPNPAVEAVALNYLANLYNSTGKYKEAEECMNVLIPIMETGLGKNDAKIGILKGNLGQICKSLKKYEKAEKCYKESIDIFIQDPEKNAAEIANAYGQLGHIYEESDRYREALKSFEKSAEIYTKLDGADSPAVRRVTTGKAGVLKALGRYGEAEAIYKKIIGFYNGKDVKPDNDFVIALNELAKLYLKLKKPEQAEAYMKKALDLNISLNGVDHKETALLMNDLSLIYQSETKYDQAEKLLLQSMEIYKKKSGEESLQVSAVYNNLGTLNQDQGKYTEAEKYLKKSLDIALKTANPDSLLVAGKFNNLAELYRITGRYGEAEPLYLKSASISEKILGADHPDYANLISNIACFYAESDNYKEADKYYDKALLILERNPSMPPFDKARLINNIAEFDLSRGKYKEALSGFEKALAICENILGKDNPDLVSPLNNIAVTCFVTGNTNKAISTIKRSMELVEKNLGPNHPSIATGACNLALFYISEKKYREASELLIKSLDIRTKALGKEHPLIANNLNSLGGLYLEMGQFKDAENYFRKSIEMSEKLYGPNYPSLSSYLGNIAIAYAGEKKIPEAFSSVKRAMEIDNRTIGQIFAISSEQEKFSFLNTVNSNYNRFLSLVTGNLSKDKSALTQGLNAVLRRKGIVLDAMASERRISYLLNDDKSRSFYTRLRELTSLIASLTLAGPGKLSPDAYAKKLADLEAERQSIEKELASKSSSYKSDVESRNVDSNTIAGLLPKGSVLVEFAEVRGTRFQNIGEPDANLYYAFVLESAKNEGASSSPTLINLGDAQMIDNVVSDFRKEMEKTRWMLESGVLDEAAAEKKLAEKGKRIYDLVIAPIKEAAGNNTTLFISPDGDLNLIPFGCIQDNNGKYLIESYNINYLSSGRDLAGFKAVTKNSGINIIAANPDFNFSKNNEKNQDNKTSASGISRTLDKTLRNWSPLGGTAIEADNIAKLLPKGETKEFQGAEALESIVKNADAPNILHIATHGFFLEDQVMETLSDTAAARGISLSELGGNLNNPVLRIENPLLRCGLIFAGANRGSGKSGNEDGILTALEISGMNLEGTSLVVLSACDTGLGKTKRGEGVFGLRRAFQLAGAKTIVMSLWSVPDQQTQELMTGFYTSLNKGMSKSKSLRESQLAMIKERREKTGAAHPYFWGAFISAGEP